MKEKKKKQKKSVPAVHILGDLGDVKKLVEIVSKKKSVVIFRHGTAGTCYADIEKVMVEYTKTDIAVLEKDFRVIYFDFFPVAKGEKPVPVKRPAPAKKKPVKTAAPTPKAIKKTSKPVQVNTSRSLRPKKAKTA